MGKHSDKQTLINRGRKAGLNTRELYAALASRGVEAGDQVPGDSDTNGFVERINAAGGLSFQPNSNRPGG
jgi:hypothetical protein